MPDIEYEDNLIEAGVLHTCGLSSSPTFLPLTNARIGTHAVTRDNGPCDFDERVNVRAHAPYGMKFAALVIAALILTGCGTQLPSDPHGTLSQIQDGAMRVGVTENPPWVELDESTDPTGFEPDLLRQFAAKFGSEIHWTVGSETVLMEALENGEIDVVIGGFKDDTVWADKGAITRPYLESETPDGTAKHVMVVRMGENGFLVALEKFLLSKVAS